MLNIFLVIAAELELLESKEELLPLSDNPSNLFICICYGTTDEGPSHEEVLFLVGGP